MARIRTIKPEFPQSESVGKLSRDARLLFVQLWTLCDDEGRTRAASRMLASLLYPYDEDSGELIDDWLAELEAEGCIQRYDVAGNRYLQVVNWLNHQRIDKPSKSKIPEFSEEYRIIAEDSGNPREPSTLDLRIKEGIKEAPTNGHSANPPGGQPELLPTLPPVANLPLVDGSEFGVTAIRVAEWSAAFPAVNVSQELAKMRVWLNANKTRRKTRKGVETFVVSWLSRQQDKPHATSPQSSVVPMARNWAKSAGV